MATQLNPNAIVDHSITAVKLANDAITSDASVAAWGYTKNTGTLTGVTFNNTAATVTNGVAAITATIPAAITETDVSNWGFTKNAGTITGITMNSVSKGTSGVVDLGTVITAHAKHKLTATNDTATAVTGTITFVESLTGTTTATDGDLAITATRKSIAVPAATTEADVSGWGFTKNTGTLTGVKFNNTDATVSNGVASITASIPDAPGTLKTNNTTAQTASSGEALSGTINLHKVAKTGTYSDLIGTPTIPAAVTETDVSNWGFTKNTGTITGITMNSTSKGTSGVVDLGTVITAHAKHKLTATNDTATATSGSITFVESLTGTTTATDGDLTVTATRKSVTIPAAPGTLNTSINTAQTTSNSEALSGTIKLHKVAKTGTYSDLIGTPAPTTDASISDWGYTKNAGTITGINMNGSSKGTSGVVDLGTVITSETALSKGNTTGSGNAVTDITVSGHQITLAKASTFLTSHQSIKTINGNTMTGTGNVSVNELPSVSSTDNGKILQVVNGAWSLVTPVSIYSGSDAPNNSQGINGDLYLQI